MSLEDVKQFYKRLGIDEDFRAEIKGAENKQECSQMVKMAGYNFTEAEFEEYTLHLLDLASDEEELTDLDERELEAVFGGAATLLTPGPGDAVALYGVPIYPDPVDPPSGGHYPPPHPTPRPRPWPPRTWPRPHPRKPKNLE
jgi:predicted ribosomally synthesized peptide with nif11-like leader